MLAAMPMHPSARVFSVPGVPAPSVAESAFVAAGAVIAGNVSLAAGASVWYNAVLRAEQAPISIGENSNLQDCVVCHVDEGFPLTVGRNVSAGHSAVLHGATIEDDCLIGMNATVLNGAVIGEGSLVAAGAVVLEGSIVPPGSLVAGIPGRVRRSLTTGEQEHIRQNAQVYLGHVARHSGLV